MKAALIVPAAVCLALALAATPEAQAQGRLFGGSALGPSMRSANAAKSDPNVLRTNGAVPEPVALEELKGPRVPLPAEPIDGFLLQKENGPFMVLAYTFTGPDAAKYAQVLTMELRQRFKLPAYIWFARVQPNRSNIYGIQPTAPSFARNGDMAPPERYRMYDQAAVLVGNCKTIDETTKLLVQVKKLKPECLTKLPTIFTNRQGKGLYRATQTTNPFQANQNLYPGRGGPVKNGGEINITEFVQKFDQNRKVDPMVKRMNAGPQSVYRNKGEFTLQVAEFSGRAATWATLEKDPVNISTKTGIKESPLMTAHEDAENLAKALNKSKTLKGFRAYVYHTLTSSMVTIGDFNAENDPSAQALVNSLPAVSTELVRSRVTEVPLRPAQGLMAVPHDR